MINGTVSSPERWLLDQWVEQLGQVLLSMADERPVMNWLPTVSGSLGSNPLVFEQNLGGHPDAALVIGVPEETWAAIGTKILLAAGIETVSEEESRNTCLEVIQQCAGGVVQALSQKLEREITRDQSRETGTFPDDRQAFGIAIQFGIVSLPSIWIAVAPIVATWMEAKTAEPSAAPAHSSPAGTTDGVTEHPAAVSKTFDLLLDVALPVSVSFGRTEIAVKDILKLTTGSIVELNRSITEPVEVIVNNCTIARGEVVVVDGNYGVRIHQIVSRQERLRTGSAATGLTAKRNQGGVA